MVVDKDKYPILSVIKKDFQDTIKVMQYKHKLPMKQDDGRLLVFSKVLISLESVKNEMLANIFFVRESFYNAVLKSPFINNEEYPTDQSKDLWSGIVDKPKGNYQKEYWHKEIRGVYVDQWCNGGYSGDEFAGDVYVKIKRQNKKDKYLKISYSM